MKQPAPVVFLLDVDNTLLDNDRVVADLNRHLMQAFGTECQERYWTIFEERRTQLGYSDYLGALQRYRDENPHDPHFLKISSYLMDYPFANRLYPGSLDIIEHLSTWGQTVILSDGDVIFQPRKVERSGLAEAVEDRVLIYIHKEQQLEDVEKHFPARRYVLVDDKLRILTAAKEVWGSRLTTVFPRQGHYARDPKLLKMYPPADIAIEHIADLLRYNLPALLSHQSSNVICCPRCVWRSSRRRAARTCSVASHPGRSHSNGGDRRNRTALRRFHGLKNLQASAHQNRATRSDPPAIHQQCAHVFPHKPLTAVSNLDLPREPY
jgi:FMN phosphatase YigB (HAD superfamily)